MAGVVITAEVMYMGIMAPKVKLSHPKVDSGKQETLSQQGEV